MVKIGGLLQHSLSDYPGKVSAVVFLTGCNMRCGFCHNPSLLKAPGEQRTTVEDVLAFLDKRADMLDGLVISGGEPTCQPGLPAFLAELKTRYRLPIKLDTNGSKPDSLAELIFAGLVDYLAMDIKTSPRKYVSLTKAEIEFDAIERSIRLIKESGLPHEFRTTVVPGFFEDSDREQIAALIAGCGKYVLQKFVPEKSMDSWFAGLDAPSDSFLKEAGRYFSTRVPCVVKA